jgi:hypothetical protein
LQRAARDITGRRHIIVRRNIRGGSEEDSLVGGTGVDVGDLAAQIDELTRFVDEERRCRALRAERDDITPSVLGCRTYCPLSVVPLPEARRRKLRSVPAVQVGLVEDLVVVLVELAVVDLDAVLVV